MDINQLKLWAQILATQICINYRINKCDIGGKNAYKNNVFTLCEVLWITGMHTVGDWVLLHNGSLSSMDKIFSTKCLL